MAYNITDEQWESVEPLIPEQGRMGRKRAVDMRKVVSLIYLRWKTPANIGWGQSAAVCGFPHGTAIYYYGIWKRSGVLEKIKEALNVTTGSQ